MRRLSAALFVGIALALPLCAQEQKTVTLPYDGPEFFCHILYSKGLTPVATFQDALTDPQDTLIIIYGEPGGRAVRDFSERGMKKFRDQGGNILIATDRAATFAALSVSVTGRRAFSGESKGYREKSRCPWLPYFDPHEPKSRDVREHPVFQLLHTGLASNWPSHINFDRSELQELLALPRAERTKEQQSVIVGFPEARALVLEKKIYMVGSAKDAPADGRALVIAGHGMFMNGMMLQPDNDNFAFAVNVVQWLREKPMGAKRSKALFVVDGESIVNFNMNLTPPPPKLPMPTVSMLNRLIRALEDEDFFHKVFTSLLGENIRHVAPIFLAFATGVLLLYGGKRVLDGRHFRDADVPRMVGAPAANGPSAARSEQREQALFRQEDAGEEARRLVRQWFQSELGIGPEQWSAGAQATFNASGSFLTRGALQRQAEFVLSLAQTTGPVKVSRAEFANLVQSLPELDRALKDGRLALLLDGKEVRQNRA